MWADFAASLAMKASGVKRRGILTSGGTEDVTVVRSRDTDGAESYRHNASGRGYREPPAGNDGPAHVSRRLPR